MSGRTVEATVSVTREAAAPHSQANEEKMLQVLECLVWSINTLASSTPAGLLAQQYLNRASVLLNEIRGTGMMGSPPPSGPGPILPPKPEDPDDKPERPSPSRSRN